MPATEKREVLYHYTSQMGLKGILESRELWASDIRYLNDASEFTHALDLAKAALQQRSESGIPDQERALAIKLLDRTEREKELTSSSEFAASLTADGDLLSQWLSYCSGGGGYAIGFDREKLEANLEQQFFMIVPCEYDRDAQMSRIDRIIDLSMKSYREWIVKTDMIADADEPNLLVKMLAKLGEVSIKGISGVTFWSDLAHLAPIFKHPSFRAEGEWRLLPASMERILKMGLEHMMEEKDFHYEPKPVVPRFREGRHSMVPYVPVSLIADGEERPPVVEIVIGPTRFPDLAKSALQQYIKTLGYDEDVSLKMTNATYRDM